MTKPFITGTTIPVWIVNGEEGSGFSSLTVLPSDPYTSGLHPDEASDDSDKTFIVPASKVWQVLWIWIELITTATVGNRQMMIEILDSADDVILQVRAGAVQAASLTRYYLFAPGMMDLAVFRDTDYLATPLPPTLILPAGFKIRVADKAAVAAAADDMVIQMQIAERAA